MLQNYFRIAVRTFLRQGGFSAINLLGLSIGLTCTFLIALWVQDERSYDAFHEQKEHLHQIVSHLDFGQGEIYSWKTVPLAMGEVVPEAIPEVEQMCFLGWDNRILFTLGEDSYDEQGFYASNNFFQLFSFSLLVGDPTTALEDPNGIVVGEELAQKLFGENYLQEAMGKTL
ncbi:MAG: ABC transporter permease, partial [Bacteroidota bacterium]